MRCSKQVAIQAMLAGWDVVSLSYNGLLSYSWRVAETGYVQMYVSKHRLGWTNASGEDLDVVEEWVCCDPCKRIDEIERSIESNRKAVAEIYRRFGKV